MLLFFSDASRDKNRISPLGTLDSVASMCLLLWCILTTILLNMLDIFKVSLNSCLHSRVEWFGDPKICLVFHEVLCRQVKIWNFCVFLFLVGCGWVICCFVVFCFFWVCVCGGGRWFLFSSFVIREVWSHASEVVVAKWLCYVSLLGWKGRNTYCRPLH